MQLRNRASAVIGGILLLIVVVGGGAAFFARHGQFEPASATGGATLSDQRDATVSNDIAQSRGK